MITRNTRGWPTNPIEQWTDQELVREYLGWYNPDDPPWPGTVRHMMCSDYLEEIKNRLSRFRHVPLTSLYRVDRRGCLVH